MNSAIIVLSQIVYVPKLDLRALALHVNDRARYRRGNDMQASLWA